MTAQDTKLGRVVSVSGSQVVMLVEGGAPGRRAPLQMGQLVKMRLPGRTIYGLVSGLSIPIPRPEDRAQEMKISEIDLLGELVDDGDGRFQRGVSALPELSDDVFAATVDDLRTVYAAPSEASVRVGTIHQNPDLPAHIATDDLLGKHFAVLGTTGSGKSCALALILHAILEQHPFGHILLLDPHNEYAQAFGDRAELVSPAGLKLPYWLFNFRELVEVIFGADAANCSAEIAILHELILSARRHYAHADDRRKLVTIDTPVPYQMADLMQMINAAIDKLDDPESALPFMRLQARLDLLRLDSRFSFMFGGLAMRDTMAEVLSRIFRIPVAGKPITIMDLSGVPSEILNVVVSVLCRMTFDFALWSDRSVPIMLICEEAHRYAPQDPAFGFEPAKQALARIAKEGRKYGVSLGLVSQRPAELAPEILSQCNTVFAMRMSNQKDQDFVRAALWESAMGLLDSLPSLRNTEAIAWGEGMSAPIRLCFDELAEDRRPRSGTVSFSESWTSEADDGELLADVVDRWRYQERESA